MWRGLNFAKYKDGIKKNKKFESTFGIEEWFDIIPLGFQKKQQMMFYLEYNCFC
jgi:hypothetical protein